MTVTTFNVQMSCSGCSSACTRILKKIDGVDDVNCSLDDQTIAVTHGEAVTSDKMLEALQKWGAAAGKTVALKE